MKKFCLLFCVVCAVAVLAGAFFSFQSKTEAAGAAGELDPTFGVQGRRIKTVPNSEPTGGHDFFSADIVIQPDGKILIAGYAFDSNLGDSMVIARYNADGTLDSGFANGGIFRYEHGNVYSTDQLRGIALQADGKIVAAGRVTVENGNPAFAVIRLNQNGTFDSTFGTGGIVVKDFFSSIDEATEVAIQTDGKILVSGWVTQGGVNNGLTYDFTVIRYNPNGTQDASFGDGGVVFTDFGGRGDLAQASVLQPDGKLVVAGWVSVPGSQYDFGLARYNTDGTLDATFDGDGKVVTPIGNNQSELLRGIALAPGGKIVATGDMYNPSVPGGSNGHWDVVAVRYNSDGSLDQTFDADGKFIYDSNLGDRSEGGEDVTVQPDGKILVAGKSHLRQVQQGTSDVDMLLMRINAGGGLDGSFGNGGIVYTDFGIFAGPFTTPRSGDKGSAITLQQDGKIVVAGDSYFAGDTVEFTGEFNNRVLGSFNNRLAVARFQNDIGSILTRRTPFDFDGDSRADISVFRPTVGEWWILKSSNGSNAAFQFGTSSDKLVPADFTGDGKTDVAIFRPSTGEWFVLRSEDSSYYSFPFGTSEDIPAPGDFDGDGKSDAAVFRPSAATWFILRSSGGTTTQQFGVNGDAPVVADYDGDGISDIAIWRASLGQWWIQKSTNNSVIAFGFGNSSDKPVQGDYTGDGKADVAFWRGSTGEWFVLRSENPSYFSVPFGQNGDITVAGDYDADGKFDPAVYRNGMWYILRSREGILIVQFGLASDVPVASGN